MNTHKRNSSYKLHMISIRFGGRTYTYFGHFATNPDTGRPIIPPAILASIPKGFCFGVG